MPHPLTRVDLFDPSRWFSRLVKAAFRYKAYERVRRLQKHIVVIPSTQAAEDDEFEYPICDDKGREKDKGKGEKRSMESKSEKSLRVWRDAPYSESNLLNDSHIYAIS